MTDTGRQFTVIRTYVRDTTFDGQDYKAGDEQEFLVRFKTLQLAEEWCECTNLDYEDHWQYRVAEDARGDILEEIEEILREHNEKIRNPDYMLGQ
jgi:hypothetical protein|tara:strand:+ start:103 stop:387 length:285 start_codon:yes stop_codon:yes gene_type:complete